MKILFLIEGRGIGGNEVVLKNLLCDLSRHGTSSILVSPPGAARNYLAPYAGETVGLPESAEGWKKLLTRTEVKLTVGIHGPLLSMARASSSLGIPCFWMYGHPYYLSGWTREDAGVALALMDRVIAQSAFLASTLSFAKANVSVIPNGVDLEQFFPLAPVEKKRAREALGVSEETCLVGYPARSVPYKRHAQLKDAFTKITTRVSGISLLFIGADSREERKGILSVQVPHFEMRRTLGACDILVFPAEEEGYGCAIAEAMAMGIPSLINLSGGHREFLPAGEEFFYNENAGDKLEDKLLDLVRNSELRERLAKRAVKYSQQLSAETTMSRYRGAFHESLS